MGSCGPRNLRSLLWQVSPLRFIWACRISQWTPAQLPRASIKASKRDPFHKGCSIHIGLGKYPLCAVHALLVYLAIRGDGPGPLFLCQNRQPLSCTLLTNWLWQIMASAGNFSSHSFRIGAATVAGCNGIRDHLIQGVGRWKSNAFQSYIRTPSVAVASLSQMLV